MDEDWKIISFCLWESQSGINDTVMREGRWVVGRNIFMNRKDEAGTFSAGHVEIFAVGDGTPRCRKHSSPTLILIHLHNTLYFVQKREKAFIDFSFSQFRPANYCGVDMSRVFLRTQQRWSVSDWNEHCYLFVCFLYVRFLSLVRPVPERNCFCKALRRPTELGRANCRSIVCSGLAYLCRITLTTFYQGANLSVLPGNVSCRPGGVWSTGPLEGTGFFLSSKQGLIKRDSWAHIIPVLRLQNRDKLT